MSIFSGRRTAWRFTSLLCLLCGTFLTVRAAPPTPATPQMQKRWLFFWRDMSDPKEIDRMIARFPQAQTDGYNGVVFAANIAPEKAAELKAVAQKHKLALIVAVMGGGTDRNYTEGLAVKDALFVAQSGTATFQPDNPTQVLNADFEDVTGNRFKGWALQDDEGVTTFADPDVKHSGKTSLRMENIGKNEARHCRLNQPIKLQPYRQYRVSFWIKTEKMTPTDPEVKILSPDSGKSLSFQTVRVEPTQDWKQYDITFNSGNHTDALLYLGSWYGKDGKLWWDDLKVEEIGLMNVLRRPGTPVTLRGENGVTYEEGRDFEKIVDPNLHPWVPYHAGPSIKLTAGTRIKDGERLRVSYYHPIIVYDERVTWCMSEPKIFDDWQAEVKKVNNLLRPAGFLMSHDELRVMNQCAACQAMKMTPGELLAWNVRKSAKIIRDLRPDAEIWVWSDMFDPMHNAVDDYYAVNGSLKGSWKGLDKDVGIMNWHGGLMGKNAPFFADLGLRQMLSGYYDGDDDGSAIAQWIASVKTVPGVVGAMYTTWEDKYGAMGAWAKKAWGKGQ